MDNVRKGRAPEQLVRAASFVLVVSEFTPPGMSHDKSEIVPAGRTLCNSCSHQQQQHGSHSRRHNISEQPRRRHGIHRSFSEVGDSSTALRCRAILRSHSIFLEVCSSSSAHYIHGLYPERPNTYMAFILKNQYIHGLYPEEPEYLRSITYILLILKTS